MKSNITNETFSKLVVKYNHDVSDDLLDFGGIYLKDKKTGHGFIADSDSYCISGAEVEICISDVNTIYNERKDDPDYDFALMASDLLSGDIELEVFTGDTSGIPTPSQIELTVQACGQERVLLGTSW
ncbi:hypothetical protein BM525_19410 (plasmid) [Alteromonas mediterranea]|uniref:Uncharacterized protein n=1 Tax=Alteromonas mediterranea TaxID=314275 RepID=A0AAC9JFJ4_9ALTE|nr:hypothetical protein [Alteromonas mediterranea]APD92052.1 hypothetical protein BM524_19215 [Alteromonas mediterranea]APD99906.1 hypothetical protein BM525_19410 [Alteromonas mediterranea]